MSPADIAATHPNKPAYIMAETGDRVTFAQLEATANQGAQLFRSLGLQRGDHIAILLENHSRFFQICWAAQRAGIYYTAISWRLQQAEVDYIVNNCEARVFITSLSFMSWIFGSQFTPKPQLMDTLVGKKKPSHGSS